MEQKKLTIHVNIDNMLLPMTVTDSDQEAVIRKAAGNLNQQLITVRERYKSVPNDRYYDVMVMLNSEIKALAAEKRNDTKPVFEIIDTLEREIDEFIKK
ncbi:MAG: cell division protein ZapA [Bacteroidaceae bacterium]|jgi:cell division protein ZapA (FtsZ GTPase activity inhibitor)|nr:cell division protein ZapA [Bacteroidaceae bacterium]